MTPFQGGHFSPLFLACEKLFEKLKAPFPDLFATGKREQETKTWSCRCSGPLFKQKHNCVIDHTWMVFQGRVPCKNMSILPTTLFETTPLSKKRWWLKQTKSPKLTTRICQMTPSLARARNTIATIVTTPPIPSQRWGLIGWCTLAKSRSAALFVKWHSVTGRSSGSTRKRFTGMRCLTGLTTNTFCLFSEMNGLLRGWH